jgi:hypothetical protein
MLEKLEGAIKYGPFIETGNIGSNTQNEDIQKNHNIEN